MRFENAIYEVSTDMMGVQVFLDREPRKHKKLVQQYAEIIGHVPDTHEWAGDYDPAGGT
jgi:hypothetical protein